VLAGLVLQIVIFGFFMLTALMFQLRIRKSAQTKAVLCDLDWERYMSWLYVVSIIVTTRNVYRVVEYVQGGTWSPLCMLSGQHLTDVGSDRVSHDA
jgi:hypothetical protein